MLFYSTIWLKLLGLFFISDFPSSFNQIVLWLSNLTKGVGFKGDLLALIFSYAIYFIWRVRNDCIFQDKVSHQLGTVPEIVNAVKFATHT